MLAFAVDGVLVLVAVILTLILTKRGFVKSVLTLGKTVLSVIAAVLFGDTVSGWFAAGTVGEGIRVSVFRTFRNLYEAGAETFDLSVAVRKIPEPILDLLRCLHVDPGTWQGYDGMNAASEETLREFAGRISAPIVSFVCGVLGYLAVFLTVFLVVAILVHLSELLTSLPGIHALDRTLGFLLGLLLSAVALLILSRLTAAVLATVSATNPTSEWAGVYPKTILLKFCNELIG